MGVDLGGIVAAGIGQTQRTQGVRSGQRQAQRQVAATGMAEQVYRLAEPLDQRQQVGDVAGAGEVRTLPVPALGVVVTQARHDQPVVLAEAAQLPLPVAVVAQRTVDQ